MRKANERRKGTEKKEHRKKRKIADFCHDINVIATIIFIFQRHLLTHQRAWAESIEKDDGYLKPYYKGLLTQTINKNRKVIDIFRILGFLEDEKVIEEVNQEIIIEVINSNKELFIGNEYDKNILKSACVSLFLLRSIKVGFREFSKSKNINELIQQVIDIGNVYFNFFGKDIQTFIV